MSVAGATHKLTGAVQAAYVGTDLTDWMALVCVCDMVAGINQDGQSFVAGLAADLSDLEVTLADETPVPWRRYEAGLFSQAEGAERLWLYAQVPAVAAAANTPLVAWRGCTAPAGEAARSAVTPPNTVLFYQHEEGAGNNVYDWGPEGNNGLHWYGSEWRNDVHPIPGKLTSRSTIHSLRVGDGLFSPPFTVIAVAQLSVSLPNTRYVIGSNADYRCYAQVDAADTTWGRLDGQADFGHHGPLATGAWHSWGLTVDGSSVGRFLVDGTLRGTRAGLVGAGPVNNFSFGGYRYDRDSWKLPYANNIVLSQPWPDDWVASYHAQHLAPADWFVLDGPEEAVGGVWRPRPWTQQRLGPRLVIGGST